jgi:hypothetical protein
VEELELLGEVELVVPLEATVLPDEEPEELGLLVGAGDATQVEQYEGDEPIQEYALPEALTSKSELLAYTWDGLLGLTKTT